MTVSPDIAGLVAGPILYARGCGPDGVRLSAVIVLREEEVPPPLVLPGGDAVDPRRHASLFDHSVWGYEFSLPSEQKGASYKLGGRSFPVETDLTGDVRIAFVSCNGQENGDEDRTPETRDVMWRRLLEEHRRAPFCLLLQGGDQLYADEAMQCHPDLRRWSDLPMRDRGTIAWTDEMAEAVRSYFFRRYLDLLRQPAMRDLAASVPTMMIWDDHDIFDGWGSHPPALQSSPVAGGIFAAAREMFVLFQLGGRPDDLPITCLDRTGQSFTQAARFPGFAVVAPDLRSEREPERVMGEAGWRAFEAALDATPEGDRQLMVSSVPVLGPRLSLVEGILDFFPGAQKYEDDLRDQWQSRGHRAEWIRLLERLEREGTRHRRPVTIMSGEIHLATRGEMTIRDGHVLHQLVASGITHPKPPGAFAFGLGALSRLGDAPLPGRPIRLKALPGRRATYTADRNYLVVSRIAGQWRAEWELEESGRTPALSL